MQSSDPPLSQQLGENAHLRPVVLGGRKVGFVLLRANHETQPVTETYVVGQIRLVQELFLFEVTILHELNGIFPPDSW